MKCALMIEEMMMEIINNTLVLQRDFGGNETERDFITLYAKNIAEINVPVDITKVFITSRETNLLQKNDNGAKIIVIKKI